MPDRESKASLRTALLKKRGAIPPPVRGVKNRLIREKLLSVDEMTQAGVLLLFASFRTEVDMFEIMKDSLRAGRKVVLPKVDRAEHRLVLYEIRDLSELIPGHMGIPEPSICNDERLVRIKDVDVVVIPGAGFDAAGNRIGYGGGYYDRLLAGAPDDLPLIAPAYEEQIVDSIPAEPHDRKVGIIVTDRRIIRCR